MRLKDVRSFFRDNKEYNEQISRLMGDLLFPQSDCYIPNSKLPDDFIDFEDSDDSNPTEHELEQSFEERLKDALTKIENEKIILAGEMGVGKTSLISHVINDLFANGYTDRSDKLLESNGLIYYKDFNTIPYDYILVLHEEIGILIESIFKDIFNEEKLVRSFLEYVKENKADLKWPFRFRNLIESDVLPTAQILLDYVGSQSRGHKMQLIKDCLFYYVSIFYKKEQKKIIFIFDNIDKLDVVQQQETVSYLLGFAQESSLKIVMCMRPITFGNISNSSIVYYKLNYVGHLPTKILAERIGHFNERVKEDGAQLFQGINTHYVNYFLMRLTKIKELIEYKNGRLHKQINAVCGHSKRKALIMFQKLFINEQISFIDPEVREDELIQAFITDKSLYITPENENVTNLFTNHLSTNSFIKLRVLQLLEYNRRNSNRATRISELITFLQFFTNYDDDEKLVKDEILQVLVEMMREKKALIYVPAVGRYDSSEELVKSANDSVFLSQVGFRFLRNSIYDLQYIQNCFYSIEWSVSKINNNKRDLEDFLYVTMDGVNNPIVKNLCEINLNILKASRTVRVSDYVSEPMETSVLKYENRFRLLRECLKILLLEDVSEIIIYINKESHSNYRVKELVTQRIITSVSESISHITSKLSKDQNWIESELNEWKNLKIIADNWGEIVQLQLT
jgi:GTPase SAR1 family protein